MTPLTINKPLTTANMMGFPIHVLYLAAALFGPSLSSLLRTKMPKTDTRKKKYSAMPVPCSAREQRQIKIKGEPYR